MKKFLSIILAAAILACPLCSFATEAAQTLNWYFCDEDEYCDPWIYNYKGEIVLGENEIKFTEDEYCDYYTFNAENDGYYYVECLNEKINWFSFPEKIANGKAYREAEHWFVSGPDLYNKSVYKLNAGETLFGIDYLDYADTDETYTITIEYLGESVTDIVLEEGALDNLILDVDLISYDYSYFYGDIEVVFSSGKTIESPDESVELWTEGGEWSKGENNATICYMGFKKDVVVTACEMTDIITDVEFVNIDEYKNVQTSYNNDYYEDIYGAQLVFTLADGTKIEAEVDYFYLLKLNGREYYLYTYYIYNDPEDVDILVSVGGIELESYECNVTKSSLAENTKNLFDDITENIKNSMYYTRLAFSELLRFYDASDFENAFSNALWYFERAAYSIKDIFYSISFFAGYYI